MLKWLHIRNLALVEEADLELSPGFNVITGETGAGKSVIMGGAALLLGGRFDKDSIRQGAARCEISSEFELSPEELREISPLLDEAGLEPCEENQLMIRRVYTSSGGRIFLNSSPATAQILRRVGELLADVHNANDAVGLLKGSAQLKALDRFAHLDPLLDKCAEAWNEKKRVMREKEEFLASMPSESEADILRKEIREIELQAPEEGEDARLEALHSAASNSKLILETASAAESALNESDDSLMDRIGAVRRLLRPLENTDPEYAEIFLRKCDELSSLISDLTDSIRSRAESVELDEGEFAALEERLRILQTLKRKYGPELRDVLTHLEEARRKLDVFENSAQKREEFEAKEALADSEYRKICTELSDARKKAAEKLSLALKKEIVKLGFKKADFAIAFSQCEPGAGGSDRIDFLFSANPGVPVKPLRDVASSGELSRVMLAVKTVLAETDHIGTVIFDEIDANIGGETASVVANELNQLGARKQILCISHLAQVAARAMCHFAVEKQTTEQSAVSVIRHLGRPDRVREIARMLGGGSAAEKHAKALLEDKK